MASMWGTERKNFRREGGFTMVELITVVVMIGILLGLGFVALIQIQKQMWQAEVDGTAREIYVAAQNHLSLAYEQGLLQDYTDGQLGQKDTESNKAVAEKDEKNAVRYLVYSARYKKTGEVDTPIDKTVLANTALDDMLPPQSIDIREAGNYIIRYQPSTGKVLDVFYAKPEGVYKAGFNPDMSASGFGTFMNKYAGDDKKDARLDYPDNDWKDYTDNDLKGIIGYYGGEDGEATLSLDAPKVEVINDDVLAVRVVPSAIDTTTKNKDTAKNAISNAKRKLVLVIKGKESEASMYYILRNEEDSSKEDSSKTDVNKSSYVVDSGSAVEGTGEAYYVILDDVTGSTTDAKAVGIPFKDVVEERSQKSGMLQRGKTTGDSFYPGEDLEIYAWDTTTNVLANVAKSSTYTVNSLFASAINPNADKQNAAGGLDESVSSQEVGGDDGGSLLPQDTETKESREIHITNFRHLTNLAKDVSGFNMEKNAEVGGLAGIITEADSGVSNKQYGAITVKQDNDLNWTAFPSVSDADLSTYLPDHDKAQINPGSTTAATAKAGTFLPVIPGYNLEYDGGIKDAEGNLIDSHCISGVVVEGESASGAGAVSAQLGDAGLFGSLDGSTVKNLELVDFSVNATAGNAGALAGTATNSTIQNVLVRETLANASEQTGTGEQSGSDDQNAPAKRIAGTTAGGLVGLLAGGSVEQSAAAVIVSGSTAAGGLVGSATDNASITESYSGGHTAIDAETGEGTGKYDTSSFNVTATGGAAGGLVGSAAGTITNCYSTCSASGNPVGGLVGNARAATITGSYATGLVPAPVEDRAGTPVEVRAGMFAGIGGTFTDDRYLKIVNYDKENDKKYPLRIVGGDEQDTHEGITAMDADTNSYQSFAVEVASANPYDTKLATNYNGKYPFRTIADLTGKSEEERAALPSHLKTHYGDWPSLETLVENR